MRLNCSKGLTLIELIVVMAIFFMLVGSSLITAKQVVVYENNLEVESCKNNILTFINKSKLYCRNKFSGGDVLFDTIKNEIKMTMRNRYVDEMFLPKDFKLKDIVASGGNTITIDKFGFISDACTISFLDKFENRSDLTICVGSGYLEIK